MAPRRAASYTQEVLTWSSCADLLRGEQLAGGHRFHAGESAMREEAVELLVVVQVVAGSSPVAHPQESPAHGGFLSGGSLSPLPCSLNMASICPPPARDLALGRDKERLRSHSLWRPSRSHDRMPASPLFKLESRCGWMQPGPAIQRALPGSTRGRPKSRRSQAHNPKVAGSNPAPLLQNPSHSGGCR